MKSRAHGKALENDRSKPLGKATVGNTGPNRTPSTSRMSVALAEGKDTVPLSVRSRKEHTHTHIQRGRGRRRCTEWQNSRVHALWESGSLVGLALGFPVGVGVGVGGVAALKLRDLEVCLLEKDTRKVRAGSTDTPAPELFSLEEAMLGSDESPPGLTGRCDEFLWAKCLDRGCPVDPWANQMEKDSV